MSSAVVGSEVIEKDSVAREVETLMVNLSWEVVKLLYHYDLIDEDDEEALDQFMFAAVPHVEKLESKLGIESEWKWGQGLVTEPHDEEEVEKPF